MAENQTPEAPPTAENDSLNGFTYTLSDLEAFAKNLSADLVTDYTTSNEAGASLKLPRGAVTIIGGQPGVGKTSLLMNLAVQTLNRKRSTDEGPIIFLSYEEPAHYIATKLMMIQAATLAHNSKSASKGEGKSYNPILGKDDNLTAWIDYMRTDTGRQPDEPQQNAFKDARAWFEKHTQADAAAKAPNLLISDTVHTISELCARLTSIKNRHGLHAAFVDYVQKVPADDKSQARYMQVAAVSEALRDFAVTNRVPIIMGAQLTVTKDGVANIRESSDPLQDASLVIILTRKGKKGTSQGPLTAEIQKSRNGPAGATIPLILDGPTRHIATGVHQAPFRTNESNRFPRDAHWQAHPQHDDLIFDLDLETITAPPNLTRP